MLNGGIAWRTARQEERFGYGAYCHCASRVAPRWERCAADASRKPLLLPLRCGKGAHCHEVRVERCAETVLASCAIMRERRPA
jgi:hypothetical protein